MKAMWRPSGDQPTGLKIRSISRRGWPPRNGTRHNTGPVPPTWNRTKSTKSPSGVTVTPPDHVLAAGSTICTLLVVAV
jgi:hypothetical protein